MKQQSNISLRCWLLGLNELRIMRGDRTMMQKNLLLLVKGQQEAKLLQRKWFEVVAPPGAATMPITVHYGKALVSSNKFFELYPSRFTELKVMSH